MRRLAVLFAFLTVLSMPADAWAPHGSLTVSGPSPPVSTPPANLVIPQISGLDWTGNPALTVNTGSWSGTTPLTFTYNWHVPSGPSLSTASTFTPSAGSALEVDVTATNTAGSATASSHWIGPIGTSAPTAPTAQETVFPVPTSIPLPVSPARFLQNTHAISNGCAIPPAVPAHTASGDTHVWYFDPVGGTTQSAGATGHTRATAFKDTSAIFNTVSGYPSGGLFGFAGTIVPGDTIYIEPGDSTHPIGNISATGGEWSTSDGTATGTPVFTWIMLDPLSVSASILQAPLATAPGPAAIWMHGGQRGFLFKGFGIEPTLPQQSGGGYAGISVGANSDTSPEKDLVFEDMKVDGRVGHSQDPRIPSSYPSTGGKSDGTVITASPAIPQFTPSGALAFQDGQVLTVTMAAHATSFAMTSAPPVGRYIWSSGYYRDTNDSIVQSATGMPNGTMIIGANGLTAAHFLNTGTTVTGFVPSNVSGLVNRGSSVTNQTLPNNNDHAGFWTVAATATTPQAVLTWSDSAASIWFTVTPSVGNTVVADGTTFTFVASGATGNQVNINGVNGSITNLIAVMQASANAHLSGSTYANFGAAFSITYASALNLQFVVSSISGATANSWTSIGTALPVTGPFLDAIMTISSTVHLAHWTGTTWVDVGTPLANLGPCDKVLDAATGCPTTNYPGLSSNIPGLDPLMTLNGVTTGGGAAVAWNGATRAISGERMQTTDQMLVLPAGYWNNNDWGTGFVHGIDIEGAVDGPNSKDPANPNLAVGVHCISVKDAWVRNTRNAYAFNGTTDSILYRSWAKWMTGDGVDVYSSHRVSVIFNRFTDPTQIWDHQDAIQFAEIAGTELSRQYNSSAIDNEFIQQTDLTNPFPRPWQGINVTDNTWWGTYVANNTVWANTNGIGLGGKYNVVAHNDMFGSSIVVGHNRKTSDVSPPNSVIGNNVANGVSRDSSIPNYCAVSGGDGNLVVGNLNIPFLGVGGPGGSSSVYCTTAHAGNSGVTAGVLDGVKAWTVTDWRTNQAGVSPVFQQFDPLPPPVAPAPGAGLWGTLSTFTCNQLSRFPFDCATSGAGVGNWRPNISFSGVSGAIGLSVALAQQLPSGQPNGTLAVVSSSAGGGSGFASSGVWQACAACSTNANGTTIAWSFVQPNYNPPIIGGGTNLGAQQPITDHNGDAWLSPPSVGAYESGNGGLAGPTIVTPFAALHTYFISPTGNDANNGLTTGASWLTPNHSGIVCGDILIAATGAYSSANFDSFSHGSSLWGTVGTCPSTSGGIDGAGQIYMVPIVCGTALACTINATTQYAMNIDKSNWAVEGFTATATASGFSSCFVAAPLLGGSSIAYDAFINDIASGCGLAGFQASNNTSTFSISTDQFAVVGSIAFNASQSAQECGSGISDNTPVNVNAQAGTHVYIAGNFSYGNIDGPCGPNSSAGGGYPTASASFSAGSSSITVNAVSGWGANWPITDLAPTGSYPGPAIPTHTFTGTIAGLTVPLTNNVTAPGVVNGDQLVVGTATDGEGVILDSWALNPYTGQAAVENNIFWGNGGHGFEAFCLGTCASALKIFALNNTIYGDAQDYKMDGAVGEVTESFSGGTLSITNNLVQASVVKATNSLTQPPWNGTTGASTHGTGQPVNAASFGDTGMTITGNWFKSAPSASCPTENTPICDGGNNIADYGGVNYQTGNTLGTDPLFLSVGSLPATAPSCGSFATTTACMASVIAALTPSASGTSGKGYQPPGPCAVDALYPIWMKGVVFLRWDGFSLTQNSGLVQKPCGL